MKIAFIDPGLDITGIATFTADEQPQTLQDALLMMIRSSSLATYPSEPLGERLFNIGDMVNIIEADKIFVEEPTYAGAYARRGSQRVVQASLNKLYMAIGAICGGLCFPPILVPASGVPKMKRFELLHHAAGTIGLPLPEGIRGGKKEDEWDAIYGGCQILLGGKYHV